MDEYLTLLIENQRLLGAFDANAVSGLTPQWFWERWIDLIDFRGDLQIRGRDVILGRKVSIITASHIISNDRYGSWSKKYVYIEDNCYIGSRAILFNCHIGNYAVVACGAVVNNMVVPDYCMVEGNPAQVIGKKINGLWRRSVG